MGMPSKTIKNCLNDVDMLNANILIAKCEDQLNQSIILKQIEHLMPLYKLYRLR